MNSINKLPPHILKEMVENPAFFSLVAFDVWLWSKQREIVNALKTHRRVAVYSATGTGKSFLEAIITIWFLQTKKDSMVALISPNYKQLLRSVWYPVQDLYFKSRIKLLGEPTSTRWRIPETNSLAEPLSYRKIESLQGIHKENMLFILDEASGIDEEVFNAVEGNLTGGDGYVLMMGNPLRPSGEFYKTLFNPLYYKVKISIFDTPNFTNEINEIPEKYRKKLQKLLPNEEYVRSAELKYGKSSAFWKAKVLGEFPEEGQSGLFNITDIEECMNMEDLPEKTPVCITVDIAREGTHSTVVAIWKGYNLTELVEIKKNNFSELANYLVNISKEHKPEWITLDTSGLGIGLYDMLMERGLNVYGVQFHQPAFESEKYSNIRTEMYFNLAQAVKDKQVKLLNYDELKNDLLMQQYEFDNLGRLKLVDKEKLRKSFGRSPDFSDAVALRFVNLNNRVGLALI